MIIALRERLEREERRLDDVDILVEEILAIGRHSAALPVRDARPDDEILGYDEYGIPR